MNGRARQPAALSEPLAPITGRVVDRGVQVDVLTPESGKCLGEFNKLKALEEKKVYLQSFYNTLESTNQQKNKGECPLPTREEQNIYPLRALPRGSKLKDCWAYNKIQVSLDPVDEVGPNKRLLMAKATVTQLRRQQREEARGQRI